MALIHDTLSPGTLLHGARYNYNIVRPLGQGSFGITYLARAIVSGDLGDLEIDVAVKEFFMREINGRDDTSVTASKSSLFGKYREKFYKEARNMSGIHHPGIIKVLESFEANNTSYYVMEYIADGSLDDYIKAKGHLSEGEAIELTRQIAEALIAIHSRGMVHLDLKPGNIMMAKGVRPVLIDFGLSKQYDDNGNPESSTTIGGGSPGYAPLEQSSYNGEKDTDIPVTMDIYALGATMYKMLTGRRAPDASSIFNDGFPEENLDKLGVSKATIDVVMKAMAPARKNRYSSVEDMLSALPGIVGSMTSDDNEATIIYVHECAPDPTPKVKSAPKSGQELDGTDAQQAPSKRSRKWIVIAIIIAIIAILGTALYFYTDHRKKSNKKEDLDIEQLVNSWNEFEEKLDY